MDRNAKRLVSALSISLFIASTLFFLILVSLGVRGPELWQQAIFLAGFGAAMACLFVAAVKLGKRTAGMAALLCLAFVYLAMQSPRYFPSIVLQLFLLSFPFAWYLLVKRKKVENALSELRVKGKGWVRDAAIGVAATLFLLYPLMLAEVILLRLIGVTDISNVSQVIRDAPVWLMAASFTVAPFAEEIFFRAFLITGFAGLAKGLRRRIPEKAALAAGVLGSTVIFMLAHYSYGSITEFIGAFTIGLIFALLFVRFRSLAMVVAAHALFNFISVMVTYYGSSLPG